LRSSTPCGCGGGLVRVAILCEPVLPMPSCLVVAVVRKDKVAILR
jgi:hypothetical protein